MKLLSLLLAPLALASSALAQVTVPVVLGGSQEVPSNTSPASGSGTFTLNPDNTVNFSIAYSGLTGGATLAHIHGSSTVGSGVAGTNAGVLLDIASYHVGTFVGSTSGQFTANNVAVNATFLQALGLGQTYFNIHSSTFGGGEIRGQIAAIPEPSVLALAVVGLGLGLVLRRRR